MQMSQKQNGEETWSGSTNFIVGESQPMSTLKIGSLSLIIRTNIFIINDWVSK